MGQDGIPMSLVILFLGVILGAMAFVGLILNIVLG
jgi:hypothetical protein